MVQGGPSPIKALSIFLMCSHMILVTFIFVKFQTVISHAIVYRSLRYFNGEVLYM